MKDFHTNVAMFAKLTQDHIEALVNLATIAQLDRETFINLTTTNVNLTQKLINTNLKLTESYVEVTSLKISNADHSQIHTPAAFDPTSYCESYGYKFRIFHSSSIHITKK